MRRSLAGLTFLGIGGALALGVWIYYLNRPLVPPPLDDARAIALYNNCQAVINLPGPLNGLTMRAPGNYKHVNLELWSRNGISKLTIGELIDQGMLVGVVRNVNATYAETIEGDWERMPKETCIFMGGDKKRFVAEVVWKTADGKIVGQVRPIAARFNADPHGAGDDAQWDVPIEGRAHTPPPGPPESSMRPDSSIALDSTRITLPAPARADLRGPQTDAVFLPVGDPRRFFESFRNVRAEGDAPWFTCSQHTCCKPL